MKLHDFLATPSNHKYFRSHKLKHFEDNLYMCEKHEIDLFVADGYKLECCDISYERICIEAAEDNPNAVWFYESWDKFPMGESVPTKLAFCEICDKNFNDFVDAYFTSIKNKNKRVKGQRSNKYKKDD